ncbi:MAG: dockerin type I repeat-containing protein [Armatimonadota bacterium]
MSFAKPKLQTILLHIACLLACTKLTAAPAGDYNGDGRVTVADAVLVVRAAVGLLSPTSDQTARCDFNGNGVLDTADGVLILQKAVGIPAAPVRIQLPAPELLTENSAAKWTEVLSGEGTRRIWGAVSPKDESAKEIVVCRTETVPVAFERVPMLNGQTLLEGYSVCLEGRLHRDQYGRPYISNAVVIARRPLAYVDAILKSPGLAFAAASLDLGPASYPTYAKATSELCKSSGWSGEVRESLRNTAPMMLGTSPDGKWTAFSVRGPRLPPRDSIVFRYLRITCICRAETGEVARLLVDIEGWVEE